MAELLTGRALFPGTDRILPPPLTLQCKSKILLGVKLLFSQSLVDVEVGNGLMHTALLCLYFWLDLRLYCSLHLRLYH